MKQMLEFSKQEARSVAIVAMLVVVVTIVTLAARKGCSSDLSGYQEKLLYKKLPAVDTSLLDDVYEGYL